jgi:hypothetical protein
MQPPDMRLSRATAELQLSQYSVRCVTLCWAGGDELLPVMLRIAGVGRLQKGGCVVPCMLCAGAMLAAPC